MGERLADAEIIAIIEAHGGYDDDYCVVLARELQEARVVVLHLSRQLRETQTAIRDVLVRCADGTCLIRLDGDAAGQLRALLPEEVA